MVLACRSLERGEKLRKALLEEGAKNGKTPSLEVTMLSVVSSDIAYTGLELPIKPSSASAACINSTERQHCLTAGPNPGRSLLRLYQEVCVLMGTETFAHSSQQCWDVHNGR